MKLEKDIIKSVTQKLAIYTLTGECIWWARLNSLKVKTIMGTWIQGCPKGTPDLIAIIRGRKDEIIVLFIECKSSTGAMRKEQNEFFDKYRKYKDVYLMTLIDISQLDDFINQYAKDYVDLLPNEL